MSEVKKVRRCYGCGEILQTEEPKSPGFTTEFQLSRHQIVLCQSCFERQHVGHDALNEPIFNADFNVILAKARASQALIVYVVDLFTFETSFISEVNEAIRDNKIILVANKFDLMPAKTSPEKILSYVSLRCEEASLKPEKIIIASAAKNYNIEEVLASIRELSDGRNVYIIGSVSSGKSALVNALLKIYKNESRFYISTSVYPNTTLKVIEIPLDDTRALYDTPGLSISNSVIGRFGHEREVIRTIVPRMMIKARKMSIRPKQSLIFGGIAGIDFLEGNRTDFTVYMSNDVKTHLVGTNRADQTFDALIKKKETKPIAKDINSHLDLDVYEIRVDYDKKCDIAIAGLGWVSFVGNKQVIRVYVPMGVSVYHNVSKL